MGIGADDFLYPANAYWTTPCTSNSLIEWNNVILPTGASISLVCYFFIFYRYYFIKSPLLRRHPTSLAIYKAVFSSIYIQQYLWLPFVSNSIFYGNNNTCAASSLSAALAFTTQFTYTASQFCFLVISIDLRTNYTNPFASYKRNRIYYAICVITISLLTGISLLVMGPHVYGPASQGTIWIQNRPDNDKTASWSKLVLRYFFIGIIYCYSIWANFQYFHNSREALASKTFSYRLPIMERSQKYTIGFIFYEIVIAACQLIYFCLKNTERSSSFLYSLPAYINSFQGLWDLVIIVYCNWADIKNEYFDKAADTATIILEVVARENLSLYPHLNTALRGEILYFVTRGISYSTQHVPPPSEIGNSSISFHDYEYNVDPVLFSFKSELDTTDSNSSGTGEERGSWKARVSYNIDMFTREQDEIVFSLKETELLKEYQKLGFVEEKECPPENAATNRSSEDSVVDNPLRSPPVEKYHNSDILNDSRNSSLNERIRAEQSVRMFRRASSISAFGIEGRQRENSISLQSIIAAGAAAAQQVFPSAYESFSFKEFCPSAFREIRTMSGIDDSEYGNAFITTTKESFSEGRSGAFVFFSSHQRYIAKTTTESEMKALYRNLPSYVNFLRENPNSFLLRYLGAYCITMYGVKLYFLVMLNIFPPHAALSERYDLKGSWVNRGPTTAKNGNAVPLYKDNDWKQRVFLPAYTMQSLAQQVSGDVGFLRGHIFTVLMDYSLLIGVEPQRPASSSSHLTVTAGNYVVLDDGTRMYIGIIDILQEFNFSKRLERFSKTWFFCADPEGISAMEPVAYAERFLSRAMLDKFQGSNGPQEEQKQEQEQEQMDFKGRESSTDETSYSLQMARESLGNYV